MGRRGWAGTTLADRRADRRHKLLDAGLDLLGTQGSAAVTVRSVCRAAGLTDRYFYENFADRDALLLGVYDEVAAEAGRVLVDAVAAVPPQARTDVEQVSRAAVDAFLDLLTGDPRKGRVLLLEPSADPTLAGRGVAVAPAFADIVRAQLGGDALTAELTAVALVGAMTALFVRWLDGTLPVTRAELRDYCVRLLVTSAQLPASGGRAGARNEN